ncbi:ADP-ribosylation factor GTPase-activating protein 2 isoform X2 [Ischnura elegans]|uniref:ADP-ribosylation factor GTPase-activating protein 2 isoform X2 n=1 Tax=Ischnura elegans TaxID=197161 RepID=UPI001ED8A834|nr:ADP-ribosylation factor GTPase-activating protein 2 isoform X2 [Ischnura elegans]
MAETGPSRNEIQLVFKKLRSIACNKVCFDCNAKNPTWASVTYGVFICIDCSAVHRGLGVHVTFVRSTQLDTNWTWVQIRHMQFGGNANARTFFRQHNCTTNDAQQKYNSRAAQLYKEKLRHLALHGNAHHLESPHDEEKGDEANKDKDVDFFEEMATKESGDFEHFDNSLDACQSLAQSNGTPASTEQGTKTPTLSAGTKDGPSVDGASLSTNMSRDTAQDSRKPTIGMRKPQAKRSTLGAKKGLGAQKVKANFAEIEREAYLADERREKAAEESKVAAEKKGEEEEKQLASMRLAYQDLSLKQKQEEEKLMQVDPKKAQQVERLGMGFGSRGGISHSALNDMKTIEQEKPAGSSSGSSSRSSVLQRESDGFFDDFQFSSGGFSMYKSSPTDGLPFESLLLESSPRFPQPSKTWGAESDQPRSSSTTTSPREERAKATKDVAPGNEAQKKFGSAKAISSDQFFRDSSDSNWERQANLSRFEGSSSISSAEYFGDSRGGGVGAGGSGGFSSQLPSAPDLEDVKESVRQGVTKVAGKLSSLANGVMSSIQRK